jgi:polygalacturonase
MKNFYFIAVLCISCELLGAEGASSSGNFKDPNAVRRVLSGEETVANAAWWGFEKENSTSAIQGAINSGAKKVIIPYVGKEWVVDSIKLVSNQEIVLDPGVVVIAKKGSFKGKFDCLFSLRNLTNVTLRGYGATLSMRKTDYKEPEYIKSEHRHVLELMSCGNINVIGLKMEHSGGDGIFITRDENFVPCRNILIRDCVCNDNYRQGVSVISVDKLRIDNCVFSNTRGTSPMAGIDLEPDDGADMLVDVVISNCISENNGGSGFIASISRLTEKSREVSVLFVNCYSRNCLAPGLRVRAVNKKGPGGLVQFENCVAENMVYSGIYAIWELTSPIKLSFRNCKLYQVATGEGICPISLEPGEVNPIEQSGGVEFINCYVYDLKNRPFLKITDNKSNKTAYNIRGDINVYSPYSAKFDLPTNGRVESLKVNSFNLQGD